MGFYEEEKLNIISEIHMHGMDQPCYNSLTCTGHLKMSAAIHVLSVQ
jgi:hypothetical protein